MSYQLRQDAFGFLVTIAGIGELINEFLPENEELHIIADMRKTGKHFWRMVKDTEWYQNVFRSAQNGGSQTTKFADEVD